MKKRDVSEVKLSGSRLREARKTANLTQKELAEKAGYSAVYISGLETGLKKMTTDAARNLGKILSVRFEYLLCEDNEKTFSDYKQRKLEFGRNASYTEEFLMNFGYFFTIFSTGEVFNLDSYGRQVMDAFRCHEASLSTYNKVFFTVDKSYDGSFLDSAVHEGQWLSVPAEEYEHLIEELIAFAKIRLSLLINRSVPASPSEQAFLFYTLGNGKTEVSSANYESFMKNIYNPENPDIDYCELGEAHYFKHG